MSKAHQLAENLPVPIKDHALVAGENEIYENRRQVTLDWSGATPGRAMVAGSEPYSADWVATPDMSVSNDYQQPGRVLVGDGTVMSDIETVQTLIGDVDPLPADGWEGALWYNRVTRKYFGPKGRVGDGLWGAGYEPWLEGGSGPTEKLYARWTSIPTIPIPDGGATPPVEPVIAQLEGISSTGTWTQTAAGLAFPVDGTYKIEAKLGFANNSGSEAVLLGQFLLDGVAPAVGPTGAILHREEASRFPTDSFEFEWTVTAGQVLSLSLQSAAATWALDGGRGGLIIKRIA